LIPARERTARQSYNDEDDDDDGGGGGGGGGGSGGATADVTTEFSVADRICGQTIWRLDVPK